jgi:hypothetical protein
MLAWTNTGKPLSGMNLNNATSSRETAFYSKFGRWQELFFTPPQIDAGALADHPG